VTGVRDLYGNEILTDSYGFDFVVNAIPTGYYASAEGLFGSDLRAALHDIIKNHTVYAYDYAWTAYHRTDVQPDGKVWDIYSDVPGGPSSMSICSTWMRACGRAGGRGVHREHSWPKSWFGGEVSPMYSDLFALYPTDAHVNGNRGNNAYGETDAPQWTSLNGSKRGPCSYPATLTLSSSPLMSTRVTLRALTSI